MVTKKEKDIKKRMKTETLEGYVFYNISDELYVDNDFYTVDNINDAFVYESLDIAQEAIENEDSPENFEIHQIKITVEVLKAMKRVVSYEEIEE